VFNRELLSWALGVLQPASASDVLKLIDEMYPEISELPKVHEINKIFTQWKEKGQIARVHGKSRLFSLTSRGNDKLSPKLRRHRDKSRLFLLKSARFDSLGLSGVAGRNLAGDSPALEGSMEIQEGTRPVKRAALPRRPRKTGPFYWPRVSQQLKFTAGSRFSSPDIYLEYYSYPTIQSIHNSSKDPAFSNDLSIIDLSLAIGISPRLITSFIHATHKHYRQFEIGKRGGGTRKINSPRVFLKVVQYWLLDYLLHSLKVHPNCNSYQKGKSILTNASPHIRKKFVANLDIVNFFGSISQDMVKKVLVENGFGTQLSKTISRIVTLENSLPQGSPTSPVISNSYLYNFDIFASEISRELGVKYTRYADDITMSGNRKHNIIKVIESVINNLKKSGLQINEKKTRIASQSGQQRVTGIVVNRKLMPPRMLRRKVRAMFHQAKKHPRDYKSRLTSLRGYFSYFLSFPALSRKKDLKEYKSVIKLLSDI
jgi:RNA-directed DNA polymerase